MAKPKHGRSLSLPSSPSPRFPSPALLSALALIATTPTPVAGAPLPTPPLTFLCPFIERDNIHPSSHSLVTLPPRAALSAPPPSPAPTSQHSRRQAIAGKYVQGSDSVWRKTDAWTLYGSTCCSTSTASTSSTQSQTTSSQSPTPTSTGEFDTSVLPAGWNDATNLNSPTESTIILALAIILAGSICVFMIVCVVWRRRKKKTRDLERKHELATDDDSQDNVPEKDSRGKMRMWARASARWKSNIRQSARRRRKRPVVSSTVNRSLSPTCSDSPQVSAVLPSAPSRQRSLVSQESDPSPLCLDGNLTEPPTVPHDIPRSASPPTYGASFVPEFSRLRTGSAVSNPEDEPLPYIPPSDGHVATDDKVQLAHIRGLASSPTVVDAADASIMPAAPEWHEIEDDLEDLGIDLSEVLMSLPKSGLPPTFPLPPSKADVPFGYLNDLSLPLPGSSGPPLGPSPSAPPIVDPGLEPSAPPLDGEDDLFQDWEGASSYDHEAPTSADLDSTPCAIESSVSLNVSSTSHTSFPCIRESAARDGILPRYHP